MKDWQRGYPLDELKAVAAVFRASGGAHTYGAFALPKERDVATARKAGRLHTLILGGQIKAAAIFNVLASQGRHRDFAGREIVLKPGDLFVSDLGYLDSPVAAATLLKIVCEQSGATVAWVEAFEEDKALTETLQGQGWRWVGSKIAAGSEIKGLYVAGGRMADVLTRFPAEPLAEADAATLRPIARDFLSADEVASVLAEVRRYEVAAYAGAKSDEAGPWAQHYSPYNKRQSWTAFCLVGYDADPSFIIKPAEMSKAWKEANPERLKATPIRTDAWDRFPTLTGLLMGRLPGATAPGAPAFERLRFMRVAARGELTRHADIVNREAGTRDGQMARLHIPIVTTPDVRFLAWDHRGNALDFNLKPGGLYYLDQRKPHAVKNGNAEHERIHVVMDVAVTPALRKAIAEGADV